MRKLLWFSLGFGISCAVGAYCFTPWLWVYAAMALLFCVGFTFVRHDWTFWKPVVAMSLGACLGLVWFSAYRHFYLKSALEIDGDVMSVTGEVTDYSWATSYGSAVDARIMLKDRRYRVQLYLKEDVNLKPGDTVDGAFRFRMTHEGLEGNTYHRGNGIFLLGYAQSECTYVKSDQTPIRYFSAVWRKDITTRLDTIFSEDVSFFAKALLIGDRSDVDYETNTAFKTSGISHIIAVSGLHVSILLSVIFMALGKQRVLAALIGVPVLIAFAAIAGFTPSITRACIMQVLMIFAMLFNRDYDPSTALAAAVLIMLAVNPIVVTSPSFQLSVGCMGGIFLFSERIKNRIIGWKFWAAWKGKNIKVRFRQWLASGVSVTLSAMFFTTPLVAYYFGCVSLIGIVTNLLTLWVVSWIFYGIMLVCLLSFVWWQGATVVAWMISWLMRYVLWIARWLSSAPFAAVYTKSAFIVCWLIFCYCLLAVCIFWKKRRISIVLSGAMVGLCLAVLCSCLEPALSNRKMTMLDVGQGQSILLQSDGKAFLVDCGGDSDTAAADIAAETLLSMGIYRLDGLILTHYDNDHAGGVSKLLSRIPAKQVYLPQKTEKLEVQQDILTAAAGCGVFVDEDVVLSWEDTSIRLLAPISDLSENERGLCVLFSEGNCDILITGDIGSEGEKRLLRDKRIPSLTALVVGHHGSKNSTGAELLAATKPTYAMISVGTDNRYGHPDNDVLERLEDCGCQVYRTDQDGTIVFRR